MILPPMAAAIRAAKTFFSADCIHEVFKTSILRSIEKSKPSSIRTQSSVANHHQYLDV
jgi:hypothetical protein